MSLVHRNSASQCSGQAGQQHRENRTSLHLQEIQGKQTWQQNAQRSSRCQTDSDHCAHPSLAVQVYDSKVFSIN
jgi:hypothetical protein